MTDTTVIENDETPQNPLTQSVAEAEAPLVEAGAGEASAEGDQSEAAVSEPEKVNPKAPAWVQKRIGQLANDKNELKAQLEEERRKNTILAELAGRQPGETEERPATPPQSPQTAATPANEVERRAREIAAANEFNRNANEVFDQGLKAFGAEFQASVETLKQTGIMDMDQTPFAAVALEQDNPSALLNHLGSNPDEALRIAALPPYKMAAEMAKLSIKLATPAQRPISRASAPERPITPAAKPEFDPVKSTMEEFVKWRETGSPH